MSKSDYNYLRSLPLVLHLPSEHAFLAHGGLLPYDPTHPISSKRQPLAHLPKLPSAFVGDSVATLRNAQELAILNDIKQNNDPWAVLNIRNLRNDNTVSRWVIITPSLTQFAESAFGCNRKKGKGRPWADIWNGTMSRCAGFEPSAQVGGDSLPCYPSTVVYGHTASRGLDIHRWTVGLDTGCVRDSSIPFFVSNKPCPGLRSQAHGAHTGLRHCKVTPGKCFSWRHRGARLQSQ